MIELRQLTKKYGEVAVVDGLSFGVRPGPGFLGPGGGHSGAMGDDDNEVRHRLGHAQQGHDSSDTT
ncbi:hypothetical protein [Microbispora rosea]|uniref:hypothetical protein n=1 Tax=Microbispora rosea TaxID=58117 RepID=UPI00343A0FC3